MAAFKPIGDKARWAIVHDRLCQGKVGDVVTYDELCELLDTQDRHLVQMAVRRAKEDFLETRCRTVVVERNVGYRIIDGLEQLDSARGYNAKAGRALVRGHSTALHIDFNKLDTEGAKVARNLTILLSRQIEFNQRVQRRQDRLEELVESLTKRQDRTDEDLEAMEKMKQRLEALEKKLLD